MSGCNVSRMFAVLLFSVCIMCVTAASGQDEIRLIVRGDDMGMTHSANMAFERAFNQGVLTSGAVQVCAPWFEEAAELCRKNPGWCVGAHLCLIGEWRGYRWRPVLPYDQVSSIVDEDGYLYTYPDELFANNPKIGEIEAEFRAQLELARKRGIDIQYIDTHYLGYTSYPGIEDVFKKLAREYDVPVSGMMNETRMRSVYSAPEDQKIELATQYIEELAPGLWLWVCHIGIESPDQDALIHTRPDHIFSGGGVGKHRAAELATLTSIQVKSAILKKGVRLMSYNDLWEEMKR